MTQNEVTTACAIKLLVFAMFATMLSHAKSLFCLLESQCNTVEFVIGFKHDWNLGILNQNTGSIQVFIIAIYVK